MGKLSGIAKGAKAGPESGHLFGWERDDDAPRFL